MKCVSYCFHIICVNLKLISDTLSLSNFPDFKIFKCIPFQHFIHFVHLHTYNIVEKGKTNTCITCVMCNIRPNIEEYCSICSGICIYIDFFSPDIHTGKVEVENICLTFFFRDFIFMYFVSYMTVCMVVKVVSCTVQ